MNKFISIFTLVLLATTSLMAQAQEKRINRIQPVNKPSIQLPSNREKKSSPSNIMSLYKTRINNVGDIDFEAPPPANRNDPQPDPGVDINSIDLIEACFPNRDPLGNYDHVINLNKNNIESASLIKNDAVFVDPFYYLAIRLKNSNNAPYSCTYYIGGQDHPLENSSFLGNLLSFIRQDSPVPFSITLRDDPNTGHSSGIWSDFVEAYIPAEIVNMDIHLQH